jgi:peptidyl-prolyl cis-trans isomerase A (cyclophilin A)
MNTSTRCFGRLATVAVVGMLTATVACKGDTPQETATSDKGTPAPSGSTASTSTAPVMTAPMATPSATAASTAAPTSAAGQDTSPGTSGGDPKNGKFALADATKGLTGTGDLLATIDTSKGKMTCKMYDDKAPTTVANFVGLARGTRPWKDPKTGTWVTRPAYNGTIFHRVIKGFMIQGGDPLGNGSGEPGYVVPDEIWSGAKHDRAGLLCMANRGPNTNGAQFFITDDAASFLDGKYTIFGECKPLDVEHAIATVDVGGPQHSTPNTPVTINSVTVSRGKY